VFVLFLVVVSLSLAICGESVAQEYGTPVRVGLMNDSRLKEVSGMIPVTGTPEHLWVHNDSDNSNHIFAIRHTGQVIADVTVSGSSNEDWEDIAIGPGPVPGRKYLYIADTGNNNKDRTDLAIWRFPEPELPNLNAGQRITSEPAERIPFRYPDSNHNCEAMIVHPETGSIYLMTKTSGTASVYRMPFNDPGPTQTLVRLGNFLASGEVTAADLSEDATRLIVRSFPAVQLYVRDEDEPFESIFSKTRRFLPNANSSEPKSEGICWGLDDRSYYTCEEVAPAPIHLTSERVPQPHCLVDDEILDSVTFRRGDVFGPDGRVDMRDAMRMFEQLARAEVLACSDAYDIDDDGRVDLDDVSELLEGLATNRLPPAPNTRDGIDLTDDSLGCGYRFGDTILEVDAVWRYYASTFPPPANWHQPEGNVGFWSTGSNGIGRGSDELGTIVEGLGISGSRLVARTEFEIDRPGDHEILILQIDYNDAFVAYINGFEVGRRNIGTSGYSISASQLATRTHSGGELEDVVLCAESLVEGTNVIAIDLRGRRSSDSSLWFRAQLRSGEVLPRPRQPVLDTVPEARLRFEFDRGPFIGSTGVLSVVCDADASFAAGAVMVDTDPRYLRIDSVSVGDGLRPGTMFHGGVATSTGYATGVFVGPMTGSGPRPVTPDDGIELAKLHYTIPTTLPRSTTIRFFSRTFRVRLQTHLVSPNGSLIELSVPSESVQITEQTGPTIDEIQFDRGEPGSEFLIVAQGLEDEGMTVTVCNSEAEFERLEETTLSVIAPPCRTEGWASVELCTSTGCVTVEEGFFYERASDVWARGDANADFRLDISDGVAMLNELFVGVDTNPTCREALDVNNDTQFDVSDPVFLLRFLFQQSVALEPPFSGSPALCP